MIIRDLKGKPFTSAKGGRVERWRKTVKEVRYYGAPTPARTAMTIRPFVIAVEDEAAIPYYLDEIVLVQ